jgi:hypothetical protein
MSAAARTSRTAGVPSRERPRNAQAGGGAGDVGSQQVTDHLDDFLVIASDRGRHRANVLGK